LDVASSAAGDRFRGGLLLPAGSDWSTVILDSNPQVFVRDAGGTHSFDGRQWSLLTTAQLTRVPITVDLGAGTVSREVLEVRVDGVPTHFAAWQAGIFTPAELANPAISGEDARPFPGRVPNLVRYALGAGAGPVELPRLERNGGGFDFSFRYNPALFDLVYRVEASNDVGDWSAPVLIFDSSVSPLQPGPEGWLTVHDPAPPPGRRFYRLRVTR
jgi:hypothetical protein